jgi:hypothetical protein
MLSRILSWPKLIGVTAGVFGLAATAAFVAEFIVSAPFRVTTPYDVVQLIASLCSVFFLLLSYPLYTGRDWARRALLFMTVCITAALLVFVVLRFLRESHVAVEGRFTDKMARQITNTAAAICIITPPFFLIFVLLHPDVKHSFRRRLDHDATQDI